MSAVIDKLALARELSREETSAGLPCGTPNPEDVRAFERHMKSAGDLDALNVNNAKSTSLSTPQTKPGASPMPELPGLAALADAGGMPVKPAALKSAPVASVDSSPSFETLMHSNAVPLETFKSVAPQALRESQRVTIETMQPLAPQSLRESSGVAVETMKPVVPQSLSQSQGLPFESLKTAVESVMPQTDGVSLPKQPLANPSSGDRVSPEFLTQQSGAKPLEPSFADAIKPGAFAPAAETQTTVMPTPHEAKPSFDKGTGATVTSDTPVHTPPTKETQAGASTVRSDRAEPTRDPAFDRHVKGESATSFEGASSNEQGGKPEASAKPVDPALEALFKDFAAMAAHMNAMTAPGVQSVEATAAPAPAQGLEAIDLNELVTRILVNTPERGATEVRMTLQDNVLKGTEISIVRGNDGLLTVRLVTDNPASFQTLVAARYDLQAILQQQEGRPVSVVMLDETEREKNDSRRRSKGLYDEKKERDA